MPCYSPLKGRVCSETGRWLSEKPDRRHLPEMEVACGQCIGCRLDRSRMWAIRMAHEAQLHANDQGNCFITLTYSPERIPKDWSLSVPERDESGRQVKSSHWQAFMKRLRKTRDHPIKFYMAGEYGHICKHGINLEEVGCPLCNTGRPHYHAILFNCSFGDLVPYACQNGTTRYTSATLERLWGHGFVDVGECTVQSAGYVARYIMKKVTGVNAEDHYQNITDQGEVIKVAPEYSQMSNGIGKEWYARYKTDVFPSGKVPVPGAKQPISYCVPRYYDEMLKAEDEAMYEDIKEGRKEYKRSHEEEFTPERLYQKYKVKKAQVKLLARNGDC